MQKFYNSSAYSSPTIAGDLDSLLFALHELGIGLWELDLKTNTMFWDDHCKELYGLNKNTAIPYEEAVNYIHSEDVMRVKTAVAQAIDGANGGRYEEIYRTVGADDGQLRWVHYKGQTYFDTDGQPERMMGTAQDVTSSRLASQEAAAEITARKKTELSENLFRSLIEEVPVATCLFVGREMTVQIANDKMLKFWGKGTEVIGLPLREAVPELISQPFLHLLDAVFTSGKGCEGRNAAADLTINGVLGTYHFDFTCQPLFNAGGEVYAIMDMVINVTEQVVARTKLEESELFARSILENSPVAKIVFMGKDMVMSLVNEKMLEMLGRDASIIGKPFMEAMPELVSTPLMDRLNRVFTTGEDFVSPEEKFTIVRSGQPYTGYYNYVCKALSNTAGEIYGIVNTALEVTEQVLARQKVEEAEESLRGATELAELGNWSIDLATGLLTYSDRLNAWFGLEENGPITIEQAYAGILQEDWPLVKASMLQAITPGTDGVYNVEYRAIDRNTGRERILHVQGKALLNEQGVAYKMNGTAQDVTEQRRMQSDLEQQVRERTEELAVSNEELLLMNEELADANDRLTHSNEELEQYAYVASHDLQEPLRKIRVFSGLLADQTDLSESNRRLVEKINRSSERMSMLIENLLDFSRLLNSEELLQPVDLGEICQLVVIDFELSITEKGAVVQVGTLPVIEAVALQMNQLFYNLLSNALKFTKPGRAPVINIAARLIDREEAKKYIAHPDRQCNYYHLTFSDNGIGLEKKYNEHIFEMFKRLHGREVFPGTGIGLTLCRRIVANQRGHLYVTSVPGEGTTFHVILPDR